MERSLHRVFCPIITFEGWTNKKAFLTDKTGAPIPRPWAGAYVVMDNLPAYKVTKNKKTDRIY